MRILLQTLDTVPAALLKVVRNRDGTYIGRFRYGDRYLERRNAVELDPFKLPLGKDVHEFTTLKGIPGAVRDSAPDAWGRRVIEQILEQLEPGTSMGGARPKATVEHDGALWLAKFPERSDRFNLQRIEFATLDLARRCGLSTCGAQLQTVGGRDVLMLQRFDRQRVAGGYFRLGLVSSLTVLDAEDNYPSRDRWSYPLLADNIRRWSSRPQRDCSYGRVASRYNLLSQCDRFGLTERDAHKEIRRITSVVRKWRERFAACGVSAKDIEYITAAMLPPSFLSDAPPGPV